MGNNIFEFSSMRKRRKKRNSKSDVSVKVVDWAATDFRDYYEKQKTIYGEDKAWDMLFNKILEREFGDPVQLDEEGEPFMW